MILLASGIAAGTQTNELHFEDPASGVSLRLPGGWVAYPRESLYRLGGHGAKLQPAPPAREWVAGFQRGADVEPPSLPRILVSVQKRMEIGDKQFQYIHAAPLFAITVAESLGFPGKPEFMRTARYDSTKQCLEFSFDCYEEDTGFVRALGRSFLTDEGMANIYCYAMAGDFDTARPEFEKIIATFELAPGHRYRPRAADDGIVPDSARTLKQFGIVLGLMVAAGAAWFFIKRRQDTVWSDEI